MLPLDYSFCSLASCPSAKTCDRYLTAKKLSGTKLAKPLSHHPYTPDGSGKCESYIEIDVK